MKLRGAIAASITPLTDSGLKLDEPSFEPLVSYLAAGGVDGLFACGTTGEGLLLTTEERRRVAELFVAARPHGFAVVIHAGALTTQETVELAGHARGVSADAVAVIAPPFFSLDRSEIMMHFESAARACEPLPFYVYEFRSRSGYAVPPDVIAELRERTPNLAGVKVSDTPGSALDPYLELGVDIFVGNEPLVLEGMSRGAVGAVSGLATAWPEPVAALVHDQDAAAHGRVTHLREALANKPFHACLKEVLAAKGVIGDTSVRAPLRACTSDERDLALSL
jgi:dihydrodipicolinate synthase/N-acetylneuraminate lyase